MQLRRLMGLSGALSYLILPVTLTAQLAGGVEVYGALDNATPVTRTLGGLSLSMGTPYLGIRGSGGLGVSSLGYQSGLNQGPSNLVWATDADLLLGPMNAGLGEGFMPYTFAGVGMQSAAEPLAFTDAIRTWSYGGGLQLALGRIVSVNGEARFRHLAQDATAADSQFVRGTEFRVGLGFHFGGGRSNSRVYAPSRRSGSRPPTAPSQRRTSSSTINWPVSSSSARGAARRVVPAAERYIGVPYRYGGTSPSTGFDCSGFVQYVYGQQGVDLPRTSRQMAGVGMTVNPSTRSLEVGDLMFFAEHGEISHVAIYAGNHRFIHSSSSGHGVRYDDLDTRRGRWFADHMVAARRVAGDGRILVSAFAGSSTIAFDHLDPPDHAPPPTP